MQLGPYLHPHIRDVRRMTSEDSHQIDESFLLIFCTGRIVTASCCGTARYTRFSSIWPNVLPRRCRRGRQLVSYLRTVIVTAAVYRGFSSSLAALPLTFRHRAGVSPYTSPYGFAETCVFSKQSVGPLNCNPQLLRRLTPTQPKAPLLPKLRGYFAEFLRQSSLDRLGILFPSTSVGLRYGHLRSS